MVENELEAALVEFVQRAVSEFRLPVQNGAPRAPVVVSGYLPPKRSGESDDFPFVIVRTESAETDREQTVATVALIVGCYSTEFDGYKYCQNVVTRIRDAFGMLENGALARKYILQYPLKWKTPGEQAYPLWQIDMETQWAFKAPEIQFET